MSHLQFYFSRVLSISQALFQNLQNSIRAWRYYNRRKMSSCQQRSSQLCEYAALTVLRFFSQLASLSLQKESHRKLLILACVFKVHVYVYCLLFQIKFCQSSDALIFTLRYTVKIRNRSIQNLFNCPQWTPTDYLKGSFYVLCNFS